MGIASIGCPADYEQSDGKPDGISSLIYTEANKREGKNDPRSCKQVSQKA
ncbi:MAG: hypothetical protein ACUVWR_17930 [Anaerolineae bacterium]